MRRMPRVNAPGPRFPGPVCLTPPWEDCAPPECARALRGSTGGLAAPIAHSAGHTLVDAVRKIDTLVPGSQSLTEDDRCCLSCCCSLLPLLFAGLSVSSASPPRTNIIPSGRRLAHGPPGLELRMPRPSRSRAPDPDLARPGPRQAPALLHRAPGRGIATGLGSWLAPGGRLRQLWAESTSKQKDVQRHVNGHPSNCPTVPASLPASLSAQLSVCNSAISEENTEPAISTQSRAVLLCCPELAPPAVRARDMQQFVGPCPPKQGQNK